MSLVWSAGTRVAVQEHAERGYPDEVCGLLIGSFDGGDKVVRQAVPVENEWEAVDERRRRFLITPDVFARQERQARRDGLEIVGFYHSHPDHPAEPSDYDREHAWPYYSYVIASVGESGVGEVRSSFLLTDTAPYVVDASGCSPHAR